MARSAEAATTVDAVAVLLAVFGSPRDELTCAVLLIVPALGGAVTTIVIGLAGVPDASVKLYVHVTVPAENVQLQFVPVAETNVTPAGSESMTVIPDAVSGPALSTLIV